VVTDPRKDVNKKYSLESLIAIIFSSVISGYSAVEEMVKFAHMKLAWLQRHVDLDKVPSAETLRILLCAINPHELVECFQEFIKINDYDFSDDSIAIDGKTMRGTARKGLSAIHMISAWSSKHGLTLSVIESKGKQNEIETIPDVIDSLCVENATITVDAMGCQTEVAKKITESNNDYILQLKNNQKGLLEEIKAFHHKIEREKYCDVSWDFFEEIDKGHGRIEIRKYSQFEINDWVENKDNWENLNSVVKVDRTRIIADKETTETSWYISSRNIDAAACAKSIRSHWQVENPLHWRLDVVFNDDKYDLYSANGAKNMAIIKRFCMNLLDQTQLNIRRKCGLKSKIMAAAIDDNFRELALFG
jgi:predicted transposase YbfD/YdcC